MLSRLISLKVSFLLFSQVCTRMSIHRAKTKLEVKYLTVTCPMETYTNFKVTKNLLKEAEGSNQIHRLIWNQYFHNTKMRIVKKVAAVLMIGRETERFSATFQITKEMRHIWDMEEYQICNSTIQPISWNKFCQMIPMVYTGVILSQALIQRDV